MSGASPERSIIAAFSISKVCEEIFSRDTQVRARHVNLLEPESRQLGQEQVIVKTKRGDYFDVRRPIQAVPGKEQSILFWISKLDLSNQFAPAFEMLVISDEPQKIYCLDRERAEIVDLGLHYPGVLAHDIASGELSEVFDLED